MNVFSPNNCSGLMPKSLLSKEFPCMSCHIDNTFSEIQNTSLRAVDTNSCSRVGAIEWTDTLDRDIGDRMVLREFLSLPC